MKSLAGMCLCSHELLWKIPFLLLKFRAHLSLVTQNETLKSNKYGEGKTGYILEVDSFLARRSVL